MLRWVLGRAVVQANLYNPVINQFFKKKISEGKHYNTALCATAKKLIGIIWSVEKTKELSKLRHKVTRERDRRKMIKKRIAELWVFIDR